ncbi:hypothetical protein A2799_03585 [Candidatus Roizmanbacteria bacterium RIFCSPHIGHO2_01_FULL_39_24]|uniref:Uncharacterized protein n=1 Tax=Candidatus Roizmanbacteria bacterium RIFCSPHIGHO2_01_FULL_39_24 TaxID=1802032 RepID=A0A1F7GL34_9BACT|nr:MAG: hypothetical protein A2799_03585 [Candidatus Roizmanbacteria bacterium RIFCSPHIGHO2_01_FULL_39_24]OGK49424.1 MAG: hypothetical protein A3A56_03180 [Candidatus Roizmanbacteria bacterium RIFCSPLOWO2_01_FULL_40_32]
MARSRRRRSRIYTQVAVPTQKTTIIEKNQYDELLRQDTVSDLRKTIVLISLLFALEFLVFYANLMGVSA